MVAHHKLILKNSNKTISSRKVLNYLNISIKYQNALKVLNYLNIPIKYQNALKTN
jgi:hypothetical protein